MKAPRPCNKPGCGRIATEGGYCNEHKSYRDEHDRLYRGNASDRGYDANWSAVRARYLRLHPFCDICLKANRVQEAELVHHKDQDSRNNADDNLQSLCRKCHAKEHDRIAT